MWSLHPSTNDFMRVKHLLKGLGRFRFSGNDQLDIRDLAYHSQAVKPGSCFVAIRGLNADGHQFIPEAVAKGATAVVVEKEIEVPRGVSKIAVEDTRDALARLSAHLFQNPTLEFRLVGITGTNGKTTTAFLLENISKAAGRSAGLVTTIKIQYDGVTQPTERTTPESYDLQKIFRAMADKKIEDCFMEVTSHALALQRTVGLHFDGAIFTNCTPDHLDFHRDMENYFSAKARLFRERLVVSEKKNLWAVLNWDDPYGRTLAGGLPAKVWRFSLKEKTDVCLRRMEASWEGLKMEVDTKVGGLKLTSPMVGDFSAANILAGVAAALAMEIPAEAIREGVATFRGAPGRMEEIPNARGIKIFVDYAHTPDALENVLRTLRALKPKRILTVFGCGGNRDRLKRPKMGKIADQYSDVVIVTSDNPRFEAPSAIIEEIVSGLRRKNDFYAIEDRRDAVAKALALAKPGDFLLIAGKGHEAYQEVEGVKRPLDDREVVGELVG